MASDDEKHSTDSIAGCEDDDPLLTNLNNVLFGPSPEPQDKERWKSQGFKFSEDPHLLFGLVQQNSGPCGVLAPVQSLVLKYLIFDEQVESNINDHTPLAPTKEQRNRALVHALSLILQRCVNGDEVYTICTTSDSETIEHAEVRGKEKLEPFLSENLSSFESQIGVLLFLYSVIASRGIEKVKGDPDDLQPLIQRFGHCSQEIVNLMLCGCAVSNVFDGNRELSGSSSPSSSGFALKGVPCRMDVGFLTILEALRYCKVGNYYKTPEYPIWVVGSSTHYTVVFGLDRSIGQVSTKEAKKQMIQTAFDQIDQHEQGFISPDQLERLLEILNLPFIVEEVKSKLNSDMSDAIILFDDLLLAIQKLEEEQLRHHQPQQHQTSQRKEEWSCTTCTFRNKPSNDKCDMCSALAPPEPSPNDPKWTCSACGYHNEPTRSSCEMCSTAKPQECSVSFELFFFNGMQMSEKVPAECHKLTVYPEGQIWKADKEVPGLTEVVQTKWPNALVECETVFGRKPKIT